MHEGGSAVQVPPEGTLLGGVYRVLGRLGEGAMGVILLARDEQLQRDVAIKLLRPEQLDNAQMQARLLAEARAMARVHHPNVVEIYAFGEYENAPYFVMQYVPGVTLDTHVHSKGGRLGLDEALSVLDQACLGVSAIHASGIAHRDVKPSNILVGQALRVVVADLGLAKRIPRGDRIELAFSGTPAYLAPEVALGRQLDPALLPRIDVYALGVVAYYLLAGRLPFQSTSTVDLVMQHAYQPPIPPSELCPDLPASFDAPVLAALAKEPDQRTASAEALREALLDARGAMPAYARTTRHGRRRQPVVPQLPHQRPRGGAARRGHRDRARRRRGARGHRGEPPLARRVRPRHARPGRHRAHGGGAQAPTRGFPDHRGDRDRGRGRLAVPVAPRRVGVPRQAVRRGAAHHPGARARGRRRRAEAPAMKVGAKTLAPATAG